MSTFIILALPYSLFFAVEGLYDHPSMIEAANSLSSSSVGIGSQKNTSLYKSRKLKNELDQQLLLLMNESQQASTPLDSGAGEN